MDGIEVLGLDREGEEASDVDECGEGCDWEGMGMRTTTVMFCGPVGNPESLTLVFELLLFDLEGKLLLGSGSGDTGDELEGVTEDT